MPTQVDDLGDNVADDDRCTTTTYASNTALWLMQYPSRVETTSVGCGQTPQYPRDAISDAKTSYDTKPDGTPQDNGTPPTAGDVTLAQELDRYDGSAPVYRATVKTKRDKYGRALEITDALGHTATSTYTPASGGPVTQLETANTLKQKSTTIYEPAWGAAKTVTDPNSRVTETAYDALGRKTEVWLPNRLHSDNPQGNARFSYQVRNDAPSAVSTTAVGPNGIFTTSSTILDSLYRPRQVQRPAPGGGRLLLDTRYDSHGRTYKTTQPYYNDQAVDTALWVASDTEVPGLTLTSFDGAERPTTSAYQAEGIDWRTTTTYGGDRVDVTPPDGGTPMTTISDARGHTRSVRQYHGSTPTGDYDETVYSYTSTDKLAGLTDSSGNRWTYTYDLHGQLAHTDDPDRGASTYTYDDLGRLATSTDARNVTLAYSYDDLSRKTGLFQGSTSGPKLAAWTYDTAAKGIGQPATSTRWVDGNAYTNKIVAYSPLYQPNIQTTTIPAVEGKLAGSYTTYTQYNPDGSLGGASYPKAGDLDVESMQYLYDDLGNPSTTTGDIEYATASDYTKYGELQRVQLGNEGKRAWLSYYYDDHTRRLNRSIVDAELAHPMQADTHYTYTPSGSITSIADTTQDRTADIQCFRYDYLQRLTDAWTPANADCGPNPTNATLGGPAAYWQSFTYDKSGNRTSDTQHSTTGERTRTYHYADPGTPKPHQLNSVTSANPPTTADYGYDQVGNTITRPGATAAQGLAWNLESQLDTITEGTAKTKFLYDADGQRLIRRDPTGTTLYLGMQEVRLDNATAKTVTTRYYTHGGLTVAMRSGGTVQWLSCDHQGTAQISINSADLTVRQQRQTPFGAPRGDDAALPGERGFVGGTRDVSTGLTHLGARDYDTALGRFISLNPVLDPADPQQINGYSYADNTPITGSDPSGLIIQMDGRPAWIGSDAINSMSPAAADRAKNYNDGVARNRKDADESRRKVHESRPRANWIAKNSPATHDRDDLDFWFSSVIDGYGPSWWFNRPDGENGNNLCFGKTGCEKARLYLRQHRDDVEGARVIAATYCLDNYDECVMNSRLARLGEDLLQVAAFVAVAGVGPRSSAGESSSAAIDSPVGAVNDVGGKKNCVSCAIAGDLTLGGTPASAIKLNPDQAIPGGMQLIQDYAGRPWRAVSGRAAIERNLQAAGEGARGIVYGGMRSGGEGHVWNAVVQNGRVNFVDFQGGGPSGPASFDQWNTFYFVRTN